jgi:hypothetical protein
MEIGSLADWLSGIGGLLAAFAALVAWRVSSKLLQTEERLLDIENARDGKSAEELEKDRAEKRRAQASRVFVGGVKLTQRTRGTQFGIYIFNGSDMPIYNVTIASQRLDGSQDNYPLSLGVLPPGEFIVPSHPDYHWGDMFYRGQSREEISFLNRGKGNKMIRTANFNDQSGDSWVLNEGKSLKSEDEWIE